jgi:hypothetical protein
MENQKLTPASDPEILRLLRAFFKIGDPRHRREIVKQVEWSRPIERRRQRRRSSAATNYPRTQQIDRGSDLSLLASKGRLKQASPGEQCGAACGAGNRLALSGRFAYPSGPYTEF